MALRKVLQQNGTTANPAFSVSFGAANSNATSYNLTAGTADTALADLKYGVTYAVSETLPAASPYELVSIQILNAQTGTLIEDITTTGTFVMGDRYKDAVIVVTNAYKTTAGISLTKELTANGLDNETFSFTLDGPDGFTASATVSGSGAVRWENNADVSALPVGSYTLTETALPANSNFELKEITGTGVSFNNTTKAATFTLAEGGTTPIAIVVANSVKEDGSLTLKKTFESGVGDFEDETFTFIVTGPAEYANGVEIVLEKSNSYTRNLTGLPRGVYTVVEKEENGYTGSGKNFELVGTNGTEGVNGAEVTLQSGSLEVEVAIQNRLRTFDLNDSMLSVFKDFVSGTPVSRVRGRTFTFNVKDSAGKLVAVGTAVFGEEYVSGDSLQVTWKAGSDRVDISKLPFGRYTISEEVPGGRFHLSNVTVSQVLRNEINEDAAALSDTTPFLTANSNKTVTLQMTSNVSEAYESGTITFINKYVPREDDGDPKIIEDDPIPLGPLPNAGGFPLQSGIVLGALLMGVGWLVRGKKEDQEDTFNN